MIVFIKKCQSCNYERNFTKCNLKDICSKVHLLGFSFFGGIKYYTFREVLVSLGIKKQALLGECTVCKTICGICPNCKITLSEKEIRNEKCQNCGKKFYTCV